MTVRAPAISNARRRPTTPSPTVMAPTPVSHADSTTQPVPWRFSPATSSAVRMPSSWPLARTCRLAPANANPASTSGFSAAIFCANVEEPDASPPTPRVLGIAGPHRDDRKKPCVARWMISRPLTAAFTARSSAAFPVRIATSLPAADHIRATSRASSSVCGSSANCREPNAVQSAARVVAAGGAGEGTRGDGPSKAAPPTTRTP